MKNEQITVGIFVFNDVEVLDFAGPFEVFSVADRLREKPPFLPILISEKPGLIRGRGNFLVQPNFHFSNCPQLDMVVIPGGGGYAADGTGYGTRLEQSNPMLRTWLISQEKVVQRIMSVCSGALILAHAGLLDGQRATIHHGAYAELRAVGRGITVVEGVKHVDAGKVVSSGGISAGIDMSLTVVSQTIGSKAAQETADYMEYDWSAPVLS